MKIVLDLTLKGELKENDIIICKNGKWCVISKESFLANITKKHHDDIVNLENELKSLSKWAEDELALRDEKIQKLQKDLVSLAKIVKEK